MASGRSRSFARSLRNGTGKRPDTPCFFGFYSTWEGRAGLFLEDLFVRQTFRGQGIGRALLQEIAGIAKRENCYGVRWEVLDWNKPAIDFYKKLGATFLDQWKSALLTGEALKRAAEAN